MVDGPPVKGEGAEGLRPIKSGDNPLGEGILFLLSLIEAVWIVTSFIASFFSSKGGNTNFLGSFFSTAPTFVLVFGVVEVVGLGAGAESGIWWLGANIPA
jgi:hypothetical protein